MKSVLYCIFIAHVLTLSNQKSPRLIQNSHRFLLQSTSCPAEESATIGVCQATGTTEAIEPSDPNSEFAPVYTLRHCKGDGVSRTYWFAHGCGSEKIYLRSTISRNDPCCIINTTPTKQPTYSPIQRPTHQPTQTQFECKFVGVNSYGFVPDGTCEEHDMITIKNKLLCQEAADAMIGDQYTFVHVTDSSLPINRPIGCSLDGIGRVVQRYHSTGVCDVAGYKGCFCAQCTPNTQLTNTPTEAHNTNAPTEAHNTNTPTEAIPAPTNNPTPTPTSNPTPAPTFLPTPAPTNNPTPSPTVNPTLAPSPAPTKNPTPTPTYNPTLFPTNNPTKLPTISPTIITLNPSKNQSPTPT
eukprot:439015_1